MAVPLIINGKHMANLFSGQFFFETPDRAFFKKQAVACGFDENAYFKALDKVPVIPEKQVKPVMAFLSNMAGLITEMSMQRLEQIELNTALKASEERWQFAIEGNGDGLWDWNIQTNAVFYSKQWKAMLGFDTDEIKGTIASRRQKKGLSGYSEPYGGKNRYLF